MPWSIEITRPARRDLAGLSKRDRTAVGRAIDRLGQDPSAVDLAKLTGREGEWRLRVGRWRAILELDNAAGLIRILRVLPRSQAYRQ